ncbi:MAG: hypothetical protein ABSD78_14515 [Acidimicrobiales bacterium]|jgi:hypothetical protein
MANQPWIPAAEKLMILVVVVCVLAMLTVVGMHLGVIPGCKASKVC